MNRAPGKIVTRSAALITRPNDSTDYTAGDVISPLLIFSSCSRENGGGGVIDGMTIIDSVQAATPLQGELWLFNAAVTPAAENAAFAPTDAELLTCVGVIPWTAAGFLGANGVVINAKNIGLPFVTSDTSTNLYGVLVARNAYDPTAYETFQVRLHIIREE